jgi:type 1 fimbria pilin
MKSLFASIALAALAASSGAPLSARDVTTVKGEVVDLACSISKGDGGRGEGHAACAMACAKRGNQMALLTADDVYLIEGDYAANANAKLLDFVARQVEAKGTVAERDGKKTINIAAMMVQK